MNTNIINEDKSTEKERREILDANLQTYQENAQLNTLTEITPRQRLKKNNSPFNYTSKRLQLTSRDSSNSNHNDTNIATSPIKLRKRNINTSFDDSDEYEDTTDRYSIKNNKSTIPLNDSSKSPIRQGTPRAPFSPKNSQKPIFQTRSNKVNDKKIRNNQTLRNLKLTQDSDDEFDDDDDDGDFANDIDDHENDHDNGEIFSNDTLANDIPDDLMSPEKHRYPEENLKTSNSIAEIINRSNITVSSSRDKSLISNKSIKLKKSPIINGSPNRNRSPIPKRSSPLRKNFEIRSDESTSKISEPSMNISSKSPINIDKNSSIRNLRSSFSPQQSFAPNLLKSPARRIIPKNRDIFSNREDDSQVIDLLPNINNKNGNKSKTKGNPSEGGNYELSTDKSLFRNGKNHNNIDQLQDFDEGNGKENIDSSVYDRDEHFDKDDLNVAENYDNDNDNNHNENNKNNNNDDNNENINSNDNNNNNNNKNDVDYEEDSPFIESTDDEDQAPNIENTGNFTQNNIFQKNKGKSQEFSGHSHKNHSSQVVPESYENFDIEERSVLSPVETSTVLRRLKDTKYETSFLKSPLEKTFNQSKAESYPKISSLKRNFDSLLTNEQFSNAKVPLISTNSVTDQSSTPSTGKHTVPSVQQESTEETEIPIHGIPDISNRLSTPPTGNRVIKRRKLENLGDVNNWNKYQWAKFYKYYKKYKESDENLRIFTTNIWALLRIPDEHELRLKIKYVESLGGDLLKA